MAFQPFVYTPSPSPSPDVEHRRMSFTPRHRHGPKTFDVTEICSKSSHSSFANAVSMPFLGTLTMPSPKKERKAAELEAQRLQAEQELKANGGKPDLAEKERVAIKELCESLGVEMKEVRRLAFYISSV